ncbi:MULTISPECIES: SRPBCC family protein [Streptomyces]|uniref:SRPBCC family protein n=1 Tax=Streptomyces olivaceus TaxID=47716 RepID=A0ABS7WF80_STROV|nr:MULTISPECIES: SRPBCC family protein [Streptomyces]MBZ6084253.1 SRPBCC family protein [Streptomyces olivaceus]MBZ6093013.1 SRPBCC family protein [Streptomyces olivaceus]MBZ6099948.1 SRPBCC family protein [Streptomyces olivaceus]MBZ6105190.1 SRPBCC family protein [Streptomyces olivaceus]MBZ6113876.1 SRPBCC family protein [Streptomyces olivaceus]
MTSVEETVEVAVPVRVAYDQWTQFKSFPRFSATVRRVEQVRPAVTHWVIGRGPVCREFVTEIVEQVPDSHLVWRSLGRRPRHRGEVRFRQAGEGRTAVTVRMWMEPYGPAGLFSAVPGAAGRVLRRELANFRTYIEGFGEACGGWRGTIRGGQVRPAEAEPPRSRVPVWPVG